MTRLQTLVKNAFPKNPESIMRQRVIWRFLTGVRDADVKKGLISSKWMASQDEPKPYSEILKSAESIQMTKVASQSLAGRGNQRAVAAECRGDMRTGDQPMIGRCGGPRGRRGRPTWR